MVNSNLWHQTDIPDMESMMQATVAPWNCKPSDSIMKDNTTSQNQKGIKREFQNDATYELEPLLKKQPALHHDEDKFKATTTKDNHLRAPNTTLMILESNKNKKLQKCTVDIFELSIEKCAMCNKSKQRCTRDVCSSCYQKKIEKQKCTICNKSLPSTSFPTLKPAVPKKILRCKDCLQCSNCEEIFQHANKLAPKSTMCLICFATTRHIVPKKKRCLSGCTCTQCKRQLRKDQSLLAVWMPNKAKQHCPLMPTQHNNGNSNMNVWSWPNVSVCFCIILKFLKFSTRCNVLWKITQIA